MEPEVRLVLYAAEGKWSYIVERRLAKDIQQQWSEVNGVNILEFDGILDQYGRTAVKFAVDKNVIQAIEIVEL